MDRLKRLQDSERELEQQLKSLKALKLNAVRMKELEFETKLKALMMRYRKTLADIMLLEASASGPERLH